MDVEQHQELIQCIASMADRVATCTNPIDRDLMVKAIGYMITLQSIVATKGRVL